MASVFSSPGFKRWVRPEVFPVVGAVAVVVGICSFQLIRNITGNPEVRVLKEKRSAGILENFSEGEKYRENFLRKFVRNRPPEVFPALNNFFSDPKLPE